MPQSSAVPMVALFAIIGRNGLLKSTRYAAGNHFQQWSFNFHYAIFRSAGGQGFRSVRGDLSEQPARSSRQVSNCVAAIDQSLLLETESLSSLRERKGDVGSKFVVFTAIAWIMKEQPRDAGLRNLFIGSNFFCSWFVFQIEAFH